MKKIIIVFLVSASLNVFAQPSTYVFETVTSCGSGEIELFEVPNSYCIGDRQAYSNWYNITSETKNTIKVEGSYNKPNSDIGFLFACKNGMITSVITETRCISGGD